MRCKTLVKSSLVSLCVISVLFCTSLLAVAAEKKVLFIDSYHEGYAWSDGITQGVKSVLDGKVDLKIHRMDTKRNGSTEFKQEAALKAKALIDDWAPDVVIAADDNASKFLIVPYYTGKDLPFVFCGVNWNASGYGFPAKNVTGMEEVSLVPQILAELKKFAKGDKVGLLGPDILTTQKNLDNMNKKFNLNMNSYLAKDFEDYKKGYLELQKTNDMVLLVSDGGLYNDNRAEMIKFARENATKPIGAFDDVMAEFALLTFAKQAAEQGEWAATKALEILNGTSPADIAITQNKKAKMYVNMIIAKNMGVQVPFKLVKMAEVIK